MIKNAHTRAMIPCANALYLLFVEFIFTDLPPYQRTFFTYYNKTAVENKSHDCLSFMRFSTLTVVYTCRYQVIEAS